MPRNANRPAETEWEFRSKFFGMVWAMWVNGTSGRWALINSEFSEYFPNLLDYLKRKVWLCVRKGIWSCEKLPHTEVKLNLCVCGDPLSNKMKLCWPNKLAYMSTLSTLSSKRDANTHTLIWNGERTQHFATPQYTINTILKLFMGHTKPFGKL